MAPRIDAADIAALASMMKSFDSGLWPLLQGLVNQSLGGKELTDPAELSKLVKTILDSCQPQIAKEDPKFAHLTKLLTSPSKPTEVTGTVKKEGVDKNSLQPKVEKLSPDQKAMTSDGPKAKFSEPAAFLTRPQLQRPMTEVAPKGMPTPQPMSNAVKEVIQTLLFFLPPTVKKDAEPKMLLQANVTPETLVKPSTKASNTEFMAKDQNPKQEPKAAEKKAPTTELRPATTTQPKESKAMETRVVEQKDQHPTPSSQLKAEKPAPQQFTPTPIRKEAEVAFSTAQAQTAAQAPTAQRPTVVPGAIPFQTPLTPSEVRRKEKRKYPHYFSDLEDGEEQLDQEDPKKQ